MRITCLEGDDDMYWLRVVHWPDLPADARCALLYGNEDAPDKIVAWRSKNPDYEALGDYTLDLSKQEEEE